MSKTIDRGLEDSGEYAGGDADDYDDYDDYLGDYGGEPLYDEYEDEPSRLLGSPGRIVALLSSLAALVGIFAVLVWLVSTRTPGATTLGAVTVTGTGSQSGAQGTTLDTAPRTGALAPDFELLDVHTNQPVKLSSLRGKPVFMNFWGTWCPPCRAEMPEMQKLRNKYGSQIQVLGVSMAPRDDPSKVKDFVDAAKYNWTFIHDPDYQVATTYQVSAIPSSYFIDKDGVIRAVQIGGMSTDQMEKNLQLALAR